MKIRIREPGVQQHGAHVVGLRGEIGGEVQEPRHHVAVEQDLREEKRRPGEHEDQRRHEEIGQAFEVVLLDAADAVDAVVRSELGRVRAPG